MQLFGAACSLLDRDTVAPAARHPGRRLVALHARVETDCVEDAASGVRTFCVDAGVVSPMMLWMHMYVAMPIVHPQENTLCMCVRRINSVDANDTFILPNAAVAKYAQLHMLSSSTHSNAPQYHPLGLLFYNPRARVLHVVRGIRDFDRVGEYLLDDTFSAVPNMLCDTRTHVVQELRLEEQPRPAVGVPVLRVSDMLAVSVFRQSKQPVRGFLDVAVMLPCRCMVCEWVGGPCWWGTPKNAPEHGYAIDTKTPRRYFLRSGMLLFCTLDAARQQWMYQSVVAAAPQ